MLNVKNLYTARNYKNKRRTIPRHKQGKNHRNNLRGKCESVLFASLFNSTLLLSPHSFMWRIISLFGYQSSFSWQIHHSRLQDGPHGHTQSPSLQVLNRIRDYEV